MIGMHFGCRERLKNFSSPVGSLSPTVAKCWYSSQRKRTCRKYCSGCASIFGTRLSTARSKSSFIITPRAFARPAFMPMGKFRAATAAIFNQPAKRRQGLAELVVGVLLGVVALLLRAEDSLHFRVVVEERKEDGDTLDDGGAEFRLDPFPIVMEPALDGFQLGKLFGIGLGRVQDRASLGGNALHP